MPGSSDNWTMGQPRKLSGGKSEDDEQSAHKIEEE